MSAMQSILVLGLLVGVAVVVIKRCEPPFDQIGLCEALAGVTGGDTAATDPGTATEETPVNTGEGQAWGSGCCKCRYKEGSNLEQVQCQRNGGDWKNYKDDDVDSALTSCNKKCSKGGGVKGSMAKKQVAKEDVESFTGGGHSNANAHKRKENTSGKASSAANTPALPTGMSYGPGGKLYNTKNPKAAPAPAAKPSGGFGSAKGTYRPGTPTGSSLHARSYFSDNYDIRPYTSYRGRMSL